MLSFLFFQLEQFEAQIEYMTLKLSVGLLPPKTVPKLCRFTEAIMARLYW